MFIHYVNREKVMSVDEKLASVAASFAMEDMILTSVEIERGRMIIEQEVDVEDLVKEITTRYQTVG
ncbi:MAG: hypothetical protein K5773_01230 [Pseudobutyrivibrio sp.]|nr:hypothetical protein [Pseudobutyrivibrio sp.]